MPEYPYPYLEPPPGWWTILLHTILLGLALTPFVGLFLQSRRKATSLDLYLWVGLFVVAPIPLVLGMVSSAEYYRAFLLGLLAWTELVCLLAIIITAVRLSRQGNASRVAVVLNGLFGLILLVIFLLPSVPTARQAAYRAQCTNNLRYLASALYQYQADHAELPPPAALADNQVATSWRVALLPYLGLDQLAARYDPAQAWNARHNLPLAKEACPPLICPANYHRSKDEEGHYYTAYAMPVGSNTLFPDSHRPLTIDPRSTSPGPLLLVEACGRDIIWTQPKDVDTAALPIGINLSGITPHTSHGLVSSPHRGGAQAARLDGSVQFLNQDIDPHVLAQLLSGQRAAP